MIDHMTLRVADIARMRVFYSAAVAPLGYRNAYDHVHCYAAFVIDPDGNNIDAVGHEPA